MKLVKKKFEIGPILGVDRVNTVKRPHHDTQRVQQNSVISPRMDETTRVRQEVVWEEGLDIETKQVALKQLKCVMRRRVVLLE